MNLKTYGLFIIIFCASLFSGCASTSLDVAPSESARATVTSSATVPPTVTPRPSATATATLAANEIRLGDIVRVNPWFTFDIPEGYIYELSLPGALINNSTGKIPITVVVFEQGSGGESEADLFINRISENVGGMDLGEPTVLALGNHDFVIQKAHWMIEDLAVVGEYATIQFENGSQFVGLAFAIADEEVALWEKEGTKAFHAILESVLFLQATRQGIACAVSEDPSYGYSTDNPVQIGGSTLGEPILGGPAKERAYLDTFLGPGGESISYVRTGSLPTDDSILDSYSVLSDGFSGDRILYIDIYNSSPVYAPVGFICGGAFPFSGG